MSVKCIESQGNFDCRIDQSLGLLTLQDVTQEVWVQPCNMLYL